MARNHLNRDDSNDLLSHYLQEIARIPRLTPERERELGERAKNNDRAAIEELVRSNLRFVVSYAKRYRNAHVHFLDLINEGNIGLIQAAKKFDPAKNVKFITYAVWWIRQSILHALSEQGGSFRLPPKRASLMYRLEKTVSSMVLEENRVPTAEELSVQLGVTVKEVQTLMQASLENFSLSDELDGESHLELSDVLAQTTVPSADAEMDEVGRREELLRQMAVLSPKERLVLTLRHGVSDNIPKRLDEIATILNRTSCQIGETLTRAIEVVCRSLSMSEGELAHMLLYTNPSPKASWTFWVALGDLPEGLSERVDPGRRPVLEDLRQRGLVQQTLEELPIEERIVVKLRYGVLQDDELTLRDIGELLDLSRERVRQIEARAEAKCRRSATRK